MLTNQLHEIFLLFVFTRTVISQLAFDRLRDVVLWRLKGAINAYVKCPFRRKSSRKALGYGDTFRLNERACTPAHEHTYRIFLCDSRKNSINRRKSYRDTEHTRKNREAITKSEEQSGRPCDANIRGRRNSRHRNVFQRQKTDFLSRVIVYILYYVYILPSVYKSKWRHG